MNFEKLPRCLIDSILGKSNIDTIAKLSQTCSTVNKLIKKKQLDKNDVGRISFAIKDEYEVLVSIHDCTKLSAETQDHGFDKSYVMCGAQTAADLQILIRGKIRQVLSSVKSVEHIDFGCLSIDDSFVQMLKEMPIQWKQVSADLVTCNYLINKSECLSLWKMFKSVDVSEGRFMEADIDVINDENVVHSRDSTVEEWYIGAVRFDLLEFRQLFDGLQELETDYSTIIACEKDGTYEIMVVYQKSDSEEKACICLNLIKPEEVFDDARMEDMPDFEDSDMEEDDLIDLEFNNNNDMEL